MPVRLPVRTTLLQNLRHDIPASPSVRLPVRTTLLQNCQKPTTEISPCDYQSERHCSKTGQQARTKARCAITSQNDTAPKHMRWHTMQGAVRLPVRTTLLQNSLTVRDTSTRVRLPVRTTLLQNSCINCPYDEPCDYQSERHCSKTIGAKSPLQRMVISDWFESLTFKKVQVNDSFSLVLMSLTVTLVLKKQNLRVLIKNLLSKRIKVTF